jgi:hypothetical protein
MGYLNNTIVTVDAILTKKGRELLARGDGSFRFTQFAIADDDIDYTLYNPNHPSGSSYYGEAIESTPILEAFPDENQVMKYKLLTLPRGTSRLPVLSLGVPNITLRAGASFKLSPETLNYLGSTSTIETGGYSATIADARVLSEFTGVGINTEEAQRLNAITTLGANVSKTVIGTTFNLRATTVNSTFLNTQGQLRTTLTIVGRDSGVRLTIPVIINSPIATT